MPSIKAKINPTNNQRQQSFTPGLTYVIPNSANALRSIPLTKALLIQIDLVQTPPILAYLIQVPMIQVLLI